MLRPWQQVFDPGNWEPLVEKILLRLERSLSDLAVRPDCQELGPIQDLLAWSGVAPAAALARVLDTGFFPQWHKALRDWLRSSACDFQEVLQWYQGWKALLEPLRDQGILQKHMAGGLEAMKHFMAKGAGAVSEELPSPAGAAEESKVPPPLHRTTSSGADMSAQPVVEEVSLSLSDYLAQVAGEEGLLFRPKKAFHNGKQVYQFGSASLYVGKSLVYVAPKSGAQDADEWRPVSMDELLRLGKTTEKPRPGRT
jgi:tuftelin-interacting protein 11